MPHLSAPARQVVRNFQPFAWGAKEYDLLLSLHDLARIDRHRTVTLFAAVVETSHVGWHRTTPGDGAPEIVFYRPAAKAGDVVLQLPLPEREPTARFAHAFAGRVVIGEPDRFADMQDLDSHARRIHDRVDTVLGYLEQLR